MGICLIMFISAITSLDNSGVGSPAFAFPAEAVGGALDAAIAASVRASSSSGGSEVRGRVFLEDAIVQNWPMVPLPV